MGAFGLGDSLIQSCIATVVNVGLIRQAEQTMCVLWNQRLFFRSSP